MRIQKIGRPSYGVGGKQLMRIMMRSGEPFAFTGWLDSWESPAGEKLHTCTITTTRSNEVVRDIHVRMPVLYIAAAGRGDLVGLRVF